MFEMTLSMKEKSTLYSLLILIMQLTMAVKLAPNSLSSCLAWVIQIVFRNRLSSSLSYLILNTRFIRMKNFIFCQLSSTSKFTLLNTMTCLWSKCRSKLNPM